MKIRKLSFGALLSLLLIIEIIMTSIGILSHASTREISFMIVYIGVVWIIFSMVSMAMELVIENK